MVEPHPTTSRWIIGPRADLALVIGMPAVCAVGLLPLAHVFGSHGVWVAVMALGAAGHHLPGFLRAYGDPALFRRYRARFLIAPPLVFAITFTLPLDSLDCAEFVGWGLLGVRGCPAEKCRGMRRSA